MEKGKKMDGFSSDEVECHLGLGNTESLPLFLAKFNYVQHPYVLLLPNGDNLAIWSVI